MDGRADDPDRVDAGMEVESPVFDGHDRVLEVRGDIAERHIMALLVQPEPRPAAAVVEDGVADPAREPVHRVAVAGGPPGEGACHEKGERDDREASPFEPPLGPSTRQHVTPRSRAAMT